MYIAFNDSVNSTKTLQWSPLQLIVDSTAAIGGVHCSVQWNPRQCFVESTARSECLRYLIVESDALQRNSLQKNRQKSGIDCNVIAFVSGLRCTLFKTAVQRNPLQIFKIPTFGTVMLVLIHSLRINYRGPIKFKYIHFLYKKVTL